MFITLVTSIQFWYVVLYCLIAGLDVLLSDLLKFPSELDNVIQSLDISVKGLSAEVEVLARDLLKISRGAAKLKEDTKSSSAISQSLFNEIDGFVNSYVFPVSSCTCFQKPATLQPRLPLA